MKTGMNLLLWTTHLTDEHFPVLSALKETGFDGVEVPVMEGDEMVGLISIGDVVKAQLAELAMEKEALESMIKGF